jgi:hypothetical protein
MVLGLRENSDIYKDVSKSFWTELIMKNNNNNNNNNKHSLRSNTKGYGGKTHYTNSQNRYNCT